MKVELYNNSSKKTGSFFINSGDYKILERLQYIKGYKNFEMNIIDNKKGREKQKLINFLDDIFGKPNMVAFLFKEMYSN